MADPFSPPIPGTQDDLAPGGFAPPVAAPPVAPVAPVAPRPFGQPSAPPGGFAPPSFGKTVFPMLALALSGRRHPAAIGAGMAAYVRGQRLRHAEREDEYTRQQRERIEAAAFYSRALEQARQFDDPLEFEQWRAAIQPMAEVYGVPLDAIAFNSARADVKKQEKTRKDAISKMDELRRIYGNVVDDPTWQARAAASFNGQPQVPVKTIYALSEMGAKNQQGLLIGPELAPTFEAFANEPDPAKRAKLIADRQAWAAAGREQDGGGPADLSRSGLDVQLVNAKRRAARGEPGADADVKLLEDTILKADSLRRDPPRITVNTGADATRTSTRIDRVGTAFNNHPIVKNFNEVQAQAETIKRVVNGAWSGPGDMSVVFAFMKALDPNSVVRETEFDNASKSGNIFSGWAARFNGALNPNGGFLSPQVKRDFLAAINARMGVIKAQYDNLRKQSVSRVDRIRSGAPETGDEALFDFAAAFPDEAPVTTAPAATAPSGETAYQRYQRMKGGK